MKKLSYLFFLLLGVSLSPGHAAVDLTWQNLAQGILDEVGTPLTGSKTDSSVGVFLQLILTTDGTIDGIDLSQVDGLSASEVLIDSSYVGFGSGFNPSDGNHSKFVSTALNENDIIYVRAWNAASPDFGSGHAPIALNGGSATFYGNSATFTLTDSPVQDFNFASFQTDIAVIPEPSTFMSVVFAGGTVLFAMRRRFRK